MFCRITLAICDSDTTTVYYKITEGLVNPEPPEVTEVKRFEMMRKRQMNVQGAVQSYKTAKLLDDATKDTGECQQ